VTENPKFLSAEEAVKALEAKLDSEREVERKCDITCCNPQAESAANHWGVQEGLRLSIEVLRSLPAVPQEEGPEAEARHAFCQTVHANLMWTHYEEASGFRVELL
jgi:hypothetical protein